MGNIRFYTIMFVRFMLVLAFVGAYFNDRPLVLFVSILAFVVTFLPKILHKKLGVKIPADFEIMIILFIYGTLFFGEVRGFYARFWWWDVLLNLGASIALGLVGLTILYVLYKDEKLDASPLVISIFTFTFAVAAGTIWEFFEFSLDTFLNTDLQQTLVKDTMIDLITNAVGALFVAITGYIYLKEGKRNLLSKLIVNFVEKNPILFRSERNADERVDKIKRMIAKGETEKVEFKATLRTNLHTNNFDKKIEHASLKTVAAFLNSEGGTLLIGVSDKGEVTGIEKDNFQTNDKFTLHLANLIKNHIGREMVSFIHFELIKISEVHLLRVDCKPSDKEVFLRSEGEEEFFVRSGPSTVQLRGSSLIDYANRRFKKN